MEVPRLVGALIERHGEIIDAAVTALRKAHFDLLLDIVEGVRGRIRSNWPNPRRAATPSAPERPPSNTSWAMKPPFRKERAFSWRENVAPAPRHRELHVRVLLWWPPAGTSRLQQAEGTPDRSRAALLGRWPVL
jgi:hypothetical protein